LFSKIQLCFHNYVDDCKDTVFEDGADVVLDRLEKAAEAVGEALDLAMGELAEKVNILLALGGSCLKLLHRLKSGLQSSGKE
jgi:hypothetical protein